jgi:hypothetical protein
MPDVLNSGRKRVDVKALNRAIPILAFGDNEMIVQTLLMPNEHIDLARSARLPD